VIFQKSNPKRLLDQFNLAFRHVTKHYLHITYILARERFFKPANNPHEERFIMRDFPAAFSKMRFEYEKNYRLTLWNRRVPSYDMGRSSGRDQMTSHEKPLPDYDPNYEIGKRGLGSSGLHFFKQLSRKPIEHKSYCMNDEFFDIDASVTLKFQK